MWRVFLSTLLCSLLAGQTNYTEVQKLFQEGVQKQRTGDLAGAVNAYERLLKIRSDVPPAHANLGVALAGLGRYREAITSYNEALKSGDNPATRLNLALAFYKLGRSAGRVTRVYARAQYAAG